MLNIDFTQMELTQIYSHDKSIMVDILLDEVIGKTYMIPMLSGREDAEKLFARFVELSKNPNRYVRAIRLGKQLVGFINDTDIREKSVELGWAVSPLYQNCGVCTAALKIAVKELGTMGYMEIIAGAFEDNYPSLRVMEKVGMQRLDLVDMLTYREKEHRCLYYSYRI